jgi:hypothetical protein
MSDKAEKNTAVTRPDIKNHCREVCEIDVTRALVDSFISPYSAELVEKKSSPQEAPRLQVARCFLIKVCAACMMRYRAVRPIWCSIQSR